MRLWKIGCVPSQAFEAFEQARTVAQKRGTRPWLARALTCYGGVHLDLFDFSGAEALAEEAREVSRSVQWSLSETSAGIDLMFNFARCGEVGRAERLVDEVAPAVTTSQGARGWFWRLRLVTAKGEIALARGAWEKAIILAQEAIAQSRRTGRLKYQAHGLEIQARALVALDRVHEAIALLHEAIELVSTTTDPILFLRAASTLLRLDGDDSLFAEAQTRAHSIALALPNEDLLRLFLKAEAIHPLLPASMEWSHPSVSLAQAIEMTWDNPII